MKLDGALKNAKSTKKLLNVILPLPLVVISIIWFIYGYIKYGFWDATTGSTPGFLPLVFSVVLFVSSIFALMRAHKEEQPGYNKESFLIVLAAIVIVLCTSLIGMIPSLLLFLFLWLKIFERCTWKSTLIVTGVMGIIIIGIFALWLKVPFPEGMIYNYFFNR